MKWLLICVFLLSAGCVQQAQVRPAIPSASTLDQWVDNKLAPYLVGLIASHPRLAGESFAVVRMSGGDIQPRIDGLTLNVRRQLTDRMAADARIHMAWLPSAELQHHRRLSGAECGNSLRADYFIGIESSIEADGRHRVAVRLLDAVEGGWVDGAGISWRGRLTETQSRAIRQTREDELLRGLRVLPFTSNQADLAAAYFANNLSCLIRQRGLSEKRVFVSAPERGRKHLRTVFSLLDNYLSRFYQVRITSREQDADYRLQPELHQIDSELFQLWLALKPSGSGEHVPGLDTAAYVRLERTAGVPHRSSRKPTISGPRLLRPPHPQLCRSIDPWAHGREAVNTGEALDPRDCFLVQTEANDGDRMLMLYLTPDNQLTRLLPGRCGSGSAAEALIALPAAESAGIGTLYALAVSDMAVEQRLLKQFEQLPDACSPEEAPPPSRRFVDNWTDDLDQLLAAHPHVTDWSALRLQFTP